MEASDAFAQGVEIAPGEDPFEGSDFGDFGEAPDLPVDPAEVPVVDKEGNVVNGGAPAQEAEAAPTPPQAAEEAPAPAEASTEPSEKAEAPPAQVGPTPEARAAMDSLKQKPGEVAVTHMVAGADRPPLDEPVRPPLPEEDPTPPAESAGPTEADALAEDPTPPSSESSPAPDATAESESGSSEDEDEVAPPPEEVQDKRGRTTSRRYYVLRVDGQGKFTQVSWYEDGQGKLTVRGPGAKRQTVALAKTAEEALKIGFLACGAPADGVSLIAVAELHFQPKKIKPMPPEPSKQRLQIT